MPIYEYKCTACSHEDRVLEKFADKGTKKCPKCGKKKLSPTITAPLGVVTTGCSEASK
jgi:putative FmdB family regulatory protein